MNSRKWSKSDRNNVRFLPMTATYVFNQDLIMGHMQLYKLLFFSCVFSFHD